VLNYGAGFGQGTEKKLRDWIETALGDGLAAGNFK